MTALETFFARQKALGRTTLVALCLSAVAASPAGSEPTAGEEKMIVNDRIVTEFSGEAGTRKFYHLLAGAQGDFDIVSRTRNQLVSLSERTDLNVSEQLAAVKAIADEGLEALSRNNHNREYSTFVRFSDAKPDEVRPLDYYATQHNRYVEIAEEVEMTLMQMLVSLKENDIEGVNAGYRFIDDKYKEQSLIDQGLARMGLPVR